MVVVVVVPLAVKYLAIVAVVDAVAEVGDSSSSSFVDDCKGKIVVEIGVVLVVVVVVLDTGTGGMVCNPLLLSFLLIYKYNPPLSFNLII